MFSTILLLCSLAFAETKTLAVQICLDQAGFSCNTIDGNWGKKSQRALAAYCQSRGIALPATPEDAYDALFAERDNLMRIEEVTQADLDSLTPMPAKPEDKAKLPKMNYGTVCEMFAERGHLSRRAMERINPGVDWQHIQPGLKLVIPDFPSIPDNLSVWKSNKKHQQASLVKISLSAFEVTTYDASGKMIALFPCSISRDKAKRPPAGELKIMTAIENPNYTYTPDFVPRGKKVSKLIFPDGPRCPVGVAWLGLNLPTYGIHGTPRPESIGSAESHGCFRLANWNAARLFALCKPGTKVVIEP